MLFFLCAGSSSTSAKGKEKLKAGHQDTGPAVKIAKDMFRSKTAEATHMVPESMVTVSKDVTLEGIFDGGSLALGKERNNQTEDTFVERLTIPVYQRAYKWKIQHVKKLIRDVFSSMELHRKRGSSTGGYFLGTIVLVPEKHKKRNGAIVDGQQRITTIFIILSLLRAVALQNTSDEETKKTIKAAFTSIFEVPDVEDLMGPLDAFRLQVQEGDTANQFLNEVYDEGFLQAVLDADDDPKRPSAYIQTALAARDELKAMGILKEDDQAGSANRAIRLAKFFWQRCFMLTVVAKDLDSAYMIFTTLNMEVRVPLTTMDFMKGHIYGNIESASTSSRATPPQTFIKEWNATQKRVKTDDGMRNLFEFVYLAHLFRSQNPDNVEDIKAQLLSFDPKDMTSPFMTYWTELKEADAVQKQWEKVYKLGGDNQKLAEILGEAEYDNPLTSGFRAWSALSALSMMAGRKRPIQDTGESLAPSAQNVWSLWELLLLVWFDKIFSKIKKTETGRKKGSVLDAFVLKLERQWITLLVANRNVGKEQQVDRMVTWCASAIAAIDMMARDFGDKGISVSDKPDNVLDRLANAASTKKFYNDVRAPEWYKSGTSEFYCCRYRSLFATFHLPAPQSLESQPEKRAAVLYIFWRLDGALVNAGDDFPNVEWNQIKDVQIEHIFPQTPKDGEWPGWTQDDTATNLGRIGNLTLLKQKENGEVGNARWSLKQPVYMQAKFQITKHVAIQNPASWTPQTCFFRTGDLLKKLDVIYGWPNVGVAVPSGNSGIVTVEETVR